MIEKEKSENLTAYQRNGLDGYISTNERLILHSWVRSQMIIDVTWNWNTELKITNPWPYPKTFFSR